MVQDSRGADHLFKLNAQTSILHRGHHLTSGSLSVGEQVGVTYSGPAADDGSFAASRVVVGSQAGRGPISAEPVGP